MYVGEIVQSDIFLCFHLVDLAGKSMSKKKQPRSPLFRIPGLAGWHLWPRSLIDIPATFLDLAGAPLAPSMQGPLKGSSRPQPGPWFNRLACVVQWQSVLAFAMWIGMHPPMMFLVHRKKTWVQHPEAIDIIEADRTYIYIHIWTYPNLTPHLFRDGSPPKTYIHALAIQITSISKSSPDNLSHRNSALSSCPHLFAGGYAFLALDIGKFTCQSEIPIPLLGSISQGFIMFNFKKCQWRAGIFEMLCIS